MLGEGQYVGLYWVSNVANSVQRIGVQVRGGMQGKSTYVLGLQGCESSNVLGNPSQFLDLKLSNVDVWVLCTWNSVHKELHVYTTAIPYGCDLNALQPWKSGCQTMGSWEVTYKESTWVHSTSESWSLCTIILRSESTHVSLIILQLCHFFLFIALQPQSATHNVVTHYSCHEEHTINLLDYWIGPTKVAGLSHKDHYAGIQESHGWLD